VKDIPLAGELAELERLGAAAQQEARREKFCKMARETAGVIAENASRYAVYLSQGHTPDEPEMLQGAAVLWEKCSLLAAPAAPHRPWYWASIPRRTEGATAAYRGTYRTEGTDEIGVDLIAWRNARLWE